MTSSGLPQVDRFESKNKSNCKLWTVKVDFIWVPFNPGSVLSRGVSVQDIAQWRVNTHLGCRAASVPLITTGDTPASWSQLYFSNTCTVSAQRPTSVLWDRNLKQGSFAGKILWKPTQVCLLWYFHATDLARGGVKLVSRVTIHSKSLVAHFWVKSSPYLEIIDAFLLKNYPHPNFGNSF